MSSMDLTESLKIKYPIIQAPMAGSDTVELVAAASAAGALGSLGAQYKKPEELRDAIAEIKRLTDKPFAVNLFALPELAAPSDEEIEQARSCLSSYYVKFSVPAPSPESVRSGIDPAAQLHVVLDERVPVFSFTLGILEDKWIRAFKKAGTFLIGTATNVKEARALEAAGVDAIIAQSAEAGGHRGTFIGSFEDSMIGGLALIPQVVDAVSLPVIAAGGIMDGRGIAAALALGAQAVQMGTAFLTVEECAVHPAYKNAIQAHDAEDTTITKVFSGGPARGIKNIFIDENRQKPLLAFPYHNSLTRPVRRVANESGKIEYTNLWSGQAGRLARTLPVKELVERLLAETEQVISKLHRRLQDA